MITIVVKVKNWVLKVPMDCQDENYFNGLIREYDDYAESYRGVYDLTISPEPEKLVFDILECDEDKQFLFIDMFKAYFSDGRFQTIHRRQG
jgi:hypothetical protein